MLHGRPGLNFRLGNALKCIYAKKYTDYAVENATILIFFGKIRDRIVYLAKMRIVILVKNAKNMKKGACILF